MAFTCTKNQTKQRKRWGGYVSIALFAITSLFTSCDSFLESQTVKNQIEQHIAYANAPSYKILVQANDEDGTIKKPITGELTQKVTDTFEIKFAPAQDHEFVRWEASSVELPQDESIYDYISFEDPSDPETKVTFKKALNSIVITAFCPPLPYVTFLLTGSRYGKYSPVKGTYTCVQTHSYPLSFDPDSDYEFVRWQIYDSKTGTEIPNGTYIKIENPTEYSTTYSLVAVPVNSEISLAIKPVIAERPQILSRTPVDNGNSFYKDSRIQVLFDHEMDESSIYYTQEELDDLKADGTADSGLFEDERNGKKVYFGYEKDGITFFKNILIKNYENQKEILNECFDPPRFETPTLLIIAANRSPEIPNFAIVHVSLEKDLSYTVEEKPVNMPKSERWIYQVKNKNDDDPPTLTALPLKDSSGIPLTSSDTTPSEPWTMNNYKNDLSLALDFTLNDTDSGSGPANKFIIERARVCDVNYDPVTVNSNSTETIYVNFQDVSSSTATYKNTYTIPNPNEQGVYRFRFAFYDKSNNPAYFPKTGYFYYNYDKTAPSFKNINAVASGNSIIISWESDDKDYKEATVYSWWPGESQTTNTTTSKTITIPDIKLDTNFYYKLEIKDHAGNTKKNDSWILTYFPAPVTSSNSSTYDNEGNITLSWNTPTGYCDGYEVTYTYNGNTITQNVSAPSLTFAAAETSNIETIPVTIKAKRGNYISEPYTYSTYSSFKPNIDSWKEGQAINFNLTFNMKINSPGNSEGFSFSIYHAMSEAGYFLLDSTLHMNEKIEIQSNTTQTKYYLKVRAEKDNQVVWSPVINASNYK